MVYKGLPHKFSLFLVPACRCEEEGCSASPWLWKRGKWLRTWQGISCSPWVGCSDSCSSLRTVMCARVGFCAAECGILSWGVWCDGCVHARSQQCLKLVFELVWSSWEALAGPQALQDVQSGRAGGCKHILYSEFHWIRRVDQLFHCPLSHLRLCFSSRLLGACTVSWECSFSSLTWWCWCLVLILG